MPSVVGLLEQREVAARRRVDGLREEADRIQAELAVAEREWQKWAIARSRVGEVLTPVDVPGQSHAQADGTAPTVDNPRPCRSTGPERSGRSFRRGAGTTKPPGLNRPRRFVLCSADPFNERGP
jgi:hypothetical protein